MFGVPPLGGCYEDRLKAELQTCGTPNKAGSKPRATPNLREERRALNVEKAMNRKIVTWAAWAIAGLGLIPGVASPADYSGSYQSDKLSVVIAPAGAGYGGEIHLGQQRFPLQAAEQGNHLTGVFSSSGSNYSFTADLQADGLTLSTGGATYVLRKVAPAAVNPLAGPQPQPAVPAPAGQAPGADPLADYTVVHSTDFGRSMVRQFPPATTTRTALRYTFPALARYFGARPTIVGAYEDAKDHASTGVSFTAQVNGQPVKGFVSAKGSDQGATVLVLWCRADAPPAEWSKLAVKPTAPAAAPAGAPAPSGPPAQVGPAGWDAASLNEAIAAVPLTPYTFPDNTGSIGIAQGWTTNSPSLGGATVVGPGDQHVYVGIGAEVLTPDSPMIRMNQQLAMNARRMGGQPPAAINMLIAPYSDDPATVLQNIIAASNRRNQASGIQAHLDTILQVNKMQPMGGKGSAAQILYDVTQTKDGVSKQYRSIVFQSAYQLGPGAWGFYVTQVIGPRDTFKQDAPVLLAQCNSVKENAAVIQQKTHDAIAASNARFQAQQDIMKQKQASFDSYLKDVQHNQLLTERSNTNFDEYIRGTRDVQDTTTGQKTAVNLGDVHQIVNNLNQYDPGRYKEIPLRDELYPLPGHEQE